MQSYGNIGPYDRNGEEWPAYCERVELYPDANKIANEEQRRAIFLSTCGASTYGSIRSLVAPSKPTDKALGELLAIVKEHLAPAPSSIMQRYTFNARSQKEGESLFQRSKWLEVSVVSSCSSQQAIKFLRHVFSTHGLPEVLVSDNSSAFVSGEFQSFVKRSGIRHITSAPYHPASNRPAERGVQSFKEALKKSSGDVEARLASFLFAYRLTPHSTTGVSPAELLFGRRPRSLLDSLHPDLPSKVSKCQERQKAAHDKHV